jgi:uncharacterized protein (DUF305 family)
MNLLCCNQRSEGVEVKMNGMSLIYNPDHQQVLDYHKELLEKAEQAQLANSLIETPKRPIPSFHKWLKHWFSDRRSSKIVRVTSQSSSSHT